MDVINKKRNFKINGLLNLINISKKVTAEIRKTEKNNFSKNVFIFKKIEYNLPSQNQRIVMKIIDKCLRNSIKLSKNVEK